MKWYMKILAVLGISVVVASSVVVAEGTPITVGKTVKFNYTLTVNDNVVESTEKSGPMEYIHGKGMIVPGLERQLEGLSVGDKKTITVEPQDGYGLVNPNAFKELPKTALPKGIDPQVGQFLELQDDKGNKFPVMIWDVKKETVVLNLNHPYAGNTLTFDVTIVDIK